MQGMGRFLSTIAGGWGIALLGRRLVEQRLVGRRVGQQAPVASIPGALVVQEDLWRGPEPTDSAYADLADAGVSLVVDLRAEADIDRIRVLVTPLDIELLSLPTVDGRVPDAAHIDRFATAHAASNGTTYVHCKAGEGRTGAIVGAWHVRSGDPVTEVLANSMAIGSLSFSQMAFVATEGRLPLLVAALDWTIDRPTGSLLRLARLVGS